MNIWSQCMYIHCTMLYSPILSIFHGYHHRYWLASQVKLINTSPLPFLLRWNEYDIDSLWSVLVLCYNLITRNQILYARIFIHLCLTSADMKLRSTRIHNFITEQTKWKAIFSLICINLPFENIQLYMQNQSHGKHIFQYRKKVCWKYIKRLDRIYV